MRSISQAIRKAPPTAFGFHQEVQKLKTIVQLLLGEIPDRATFRIDYLRAPLQPYFELTQGLSIACGGTSVSGAQLCASAT